MAEVIRLSDRKPIPPKQIVDRDGKQTYTVTFDPNAPHHSRWVWHVEYVRSYPYTGSTSTQASAVKEARKLIHAMNMHVIKWEEDNA